MSASEEGLVKILENLPEQKPRVSCMSRIRPIAPTKQISISSTSDLSMRSLTENVQAIVACGPFSQKDYAERLKTRYLHIKCSTGKQGSRDLRFELLKLRDFLPKLAIQDVDSLHICCETGKDISAGVALAVLCLCARDDGKNN